MDSSHIDIFSCTRLLSAGLRVSSPPQRCKVVRKLQFVPDEDCLSSPLSSSKSRTRMPLEVHDQNSQDSGCALSDAQSLSSFRFVEPCGLPPKRLNSMESPRRCLKFSSYSSENSCSSNDDGFVDMLCSPLKPEEENARLPSSIGSLISGQILSENKNSTTPRIRRSNFTARECLSEKSTTKQCLSFFRQELSLKRPLLQTAENKSPEKENCLTSSPTSSHFLQKIKRVKLLKDDECDKEETKKSTLFHFGFRKEMLQKDSEEDKPIKSTTDNEATIKMALQRSAQEDLIGDFSRPFALPLMEGKHQDLKTISSDTLAKLIRGEFKDRIESFKIIDCRYPYEYEGGHIKGAVNIYTCDEVSRTLLHKKASLPLPSTSMASQTTLEEKRNILIFHCEFSSERGPFLTRFLRKEDRAGNRYPCLHYPEVYLLHGGYSNFFKHHDQLCEPRSYREMNDPEHTNELKHFRAKSKSWAPGNHKKHSLRSLTRLQF